MDLDALIKRTEAKLAAETNPKRRAEIALDLATYAKTRAECDDDEDEDDEEDEKKFKKSAKNAEEEKKASATAAPAESKKAAEEKKATKKSEEDEEEEEESKAALALIERSTGLKGSAAIGAAAAVFSRFEQVAADTETLKKTAAATEKASLIASAKKHVPRSQLEWLEGQKLSVVRGFVQKALEGAPMVHTEEGDLLVAKLPQGAEPESALPKDVRDMIDACAAVFPGDAKARAEFRKVLVTQNLEARAKSMNGAPGVY